MNWPVNNDKILLAIREAFEDGDWWIYKGKRVFGFEKRFAEFHGCKYGVSVCNGTIPLEIVLHVLGIGEGHRVILPAYNYYSLPKSVENTGAKPLFADVCKENLTIDIEEVKRNLTRDVKAVVAVHITGSVAKVDELRDLCDTTGVFLIEDCAQAAGAVYDGKRVGSFGRAGIFSFGGIKLMTCGQGGMIVTSDRELYEKCHAVVNRGYMPGIYGVERKINPYGIVGENFQMSELSAVILAPQLDIIEELCRKREEVMRFLDTSLGKIPGLTPLKQWEKTLYRAQMRYSFIYDEVKISREDFVGRANEKDIPLSVMGHKAVSNDEQQFRKYSAEKDFPVADYFQDRLISIHHTDILRGMEYWEKAVEQLGNILK